MDKQELFFYGLMLIIGLIAIGLLILAWFISPVIFIISLAAFFVGLFIGR